MMTMPGEFRVSSIVPPSFEFAGCQLSNSENPLEIRDGALAGVTDP